MKVDIEKERKHDGFVFVVVRLDGGFSNCFAVGKEDNPDFEDNLKKAISSAKEHVENKINPPKVETLESYEV